MIDLTRLSDGIAAVHSLPTDPGDSWIKDAEIAVNPPPDRESDPVPEERWPARDGHSGVYGAVSPRVLVLPDGEFRLYYTQILPRRGFPAGANDYGNSTTRILSATSSDGSEWTPEAGVRLTPMAGGAGEFRVVSSEVVPAGDSVGRLRMYYECCRGQQMRQNSVRSAISEDGGTTWNPEPGARLETAGRYYAAPRVVFLDDGRCRLYCYEGDKGIVSALSVDGGLTFEWEPGVRIAQDGSYDGNSAFAPEIVRIQDGGYRMYYAGYSTPSRAFILTALSDDGLEWHKSKEPVVSPTGYGWDAAKCSEMTVLPLPPQGGRASKYRMLYEACDGSAEDERGVWRVASASSNA
jgi:hypothetical protein